MQESSFSFLEKKTTKFTNINFEDMSRGRSTNTDDPKCPAEVLMATGEKMSTHSRPDKSGTFPDQKMSMMGDIVALPTIKKDFSKKQRNPSFVRFYERSGVGDNIPEQDYGRRRAPFHTNRNVTVFLEDDFNKKTQSTETEQKYLKSKQAKMEVVFIDEEVPPEKDVEIKRNLFDFYFYIIFLCFMTVVALAMVSSNMYYFANVTVNLFFDTPTHQPGNDSTAVTANWSPFGKTLRNSRTFGDFWAYAESTMIDLFYWDFYYSKIDPVPHTEEDDRRILYESELFGVPRMRQVRVTNNSCTIHPDMKRFFRTCYSYYSVFAEDTKPIREDMGNSDTRTAWVYTTAEELNSIYYWGDLAFYGGGGYYLDFDIHKNKTIQMIRELKDNFWVSRATRAIFINFNLYNANVNLFLICKIVLEFPPVGGMIPKQDFHALKLIRYLTALDFFILACEVVVAFFAIYFTALTIDNIIRQKVSYFVYWRNYLDLIIILLLYAYVIIGVVRFFVASNTIASLQTRYFIYTEFDFVRELQIGYDGTIAILVFLCWIKLFTYLNFNVVMLDFRKTLARSLKDILGFFPMFLTLFFAFSVLAYLLFGNQLKDYQSIWTSFLSLLQAFLGEFEYGPIQESHHILGPIFYISFIFFAFFVLLNVFIAIINDAYASVKAEVISDRPKSGEYIKRGLINFLCCCRTRRSKKIKKKSSVKKKILFHDIKKILTNAGFTEDEIQIFFARYRINLDNILDEKSKKKVLEDLELERIDFSENSEQFQINEIRRKIESLNIKIQDIDMNLQPVIDKIDIIMAKRA